MSSRPTLADVARAAGVSAAVASVVLNPQSKALHIRAGEASIRRIREAAKNLGYAPNYHARSIRLGHAQTLGLALEVPRPGTEIAPSRLARFFLELCEGAQQAAHHACYGLLLLGNDPGHSAPTRGLAAVRERRLDGLLLPASGLQTAEFEMLAEARDLPIVLIEPRIQTDLPALMFDDAAAINLALDHLRQLGHRDVLWFTPDAQINTSGQVREDEFTAATAKAGMRGEICHLGEETHDRHITDTMMADAAERAMVRRLAQERKFTAVMCYNDLVALGACRSLLDKGLRIPQDVSVVGFDNIQAKDAYPPLTSVDHRIFEMGRRAAELVLEMSTGGDEARQRVVGLREVVGAQLVVRRSTGPAPA